MKRANDKPTGWVLPSGKFVALDTSTHEHWLRQNSDSLEKFGLVLTDVEQPYDRLLALNKGFARTREYGGKLTIEVNKRFFRGAVKRALEDLLLKHADNLDAVNVHLADNDGNLLAQSTARLFDAENPTSAALSALEEL